MTKTSLTLLAIVLAVAVPLAGCIGGSSTSDAPADADVQTDGDANVNETLSSGERPHVHDRWTSPSGSPVEEIALVDREVPIEAASQDNPNLLNECRMYPQNGPAVCLGQATFFPEELGDGTTKIVPPGTEKITLQLEYSSSDFDRIRFWYQHRMSNGQWKSIGTFESGEKKVISPVPVEISDDGHAHVSQWKFHMEPEGNPDAGSDHAWYGEGPVQVQITAHRQEGQLPVEPPHPDFWVDSDTYRLSTVDDSVGDFTHAVRTHVERGGCPTEVFGTCAPVQANSEGLFWILRPGYQGDRLGAGELPPELTGEHDRALVPPGASVLGAAIHVDGQTTRGVEVCFRAMSSPDEGPYGRVIACEEYAGGPADFTVSTALTQKDLDSFYTDNTGHNASRWTFFVQISAPDTAGKDTVGGFRGSVSAAVFVSQADTFQLPAWANVGQGGSA